MDFSESRTLELIPAPSLLSGLQHFNNNKIKRQIIYMFILFRSNLIRQGWSTCQVLMSKPLDNVGPTLKNTASKLARSPWQGGSTCREIQHQLA